MAPVGQPSRQRRHAPQPSGAGSAATGRGASVTTAPRTNHEPRIGQQQVGVLAEPADAGPVGDLAIDHGVVVGDHHGPVTVGPEVKGDGLQRLTQRGVVIGPGVAGDTTERPTVGSRPTVGCRCRKVRGVAAGSDHDGRRVGHDAVRRGRAGRVAVRELHAAVQAGGLPLVQDLPRPGERRGGGDAHRVESVGSSDGLDLAGQLLGGDGRDRRGCTHPSTVPKPIRPSPSRATPLAGAVTRACAAARAPARPRPAGGAPGAPTGPAGPPRPAPARTGT